MARRAGTMVGVKAPQRLGAPRSSQARARPTPRAGVPRVGAPRAATAPRSTAQHAVQPRSTAQHSAPVVSPPSAASSMSWRAVVLTAVMALALAVMVPSARAYLKQQETLQDLQGQVVDAQAQVDELQGQAARWNDPAYVVAQARDRLVYVLPGETPYRVVDPEFVIDPAASDNPPANAGLPGVTAPVRPWFATLWGSIERAGAGA